MYKLQSEHYWEHAAMHVSATATENGVDVVFPTPYQICQSKKYTLVLEVQVNKHSQLS